MSAAVAITIRRKKLVKHFREAGATDPDHAITLASIGERQSWVFNQMVKQSVFLPAPGNRFYMDERAAADFLRRKRNRALKIGRIFLLVFLVLWLARLGKQVLYG